MSDFDWEGLVPRVWGPGVRPSQFPLLKRSPSRRPRARGRACPRVSGGPRRLTGIPPVWGPGAAPAGAGDGRPRSWGGGPPGPRGHAPSPCGGHGGVSGGPVSPMWATAGRPGVGGGPPSMAPPSGPSPGRLFRAVRWERRGALASVQGGGVAGAGQTGRAEGVLGVAPPPPAGVAVTRVPLGESSMGGGAERAAGADGAPLLVYRGP